MLSVKGVFHIPLTIKPFGSLWGRDEFSNPQSSLLEETSLKFQSSNRNTRSMESLHGNQLIQICILLSEPTDKTPFSGAV